MPRAAKGSCSSTHSRGFALAAQATVKSLVSELIVVLLPGGSPHRRSLRSRFGRGRRAATAALLTRGEESSCFDSNAGDIGVSCQGNDHILQTSRTRATEAPG